MSGPLISVIMGVYYRREDVTVLEQAVASILQQTERNLEFLICDDGSGEAARQLLVHIAQEDDRVRLLRPGGKIMLSDKLNDCIRAARGTYIARMDDDDCSHPERFARQVAFLEDHPDIGFVGCNVNLKCAGEVVGKRILPEYPAVQDFYFKQPYIHPALMFRKDALLSVEGYSEEKHALLCEDYDLLLRLYAKGCKGMNLQEILFDYTVPVTAKGGRKMRHRWNEAVTRYRRFQELGVLPQAWPYVMKPIAVGLLPEYVLKRLKIRYDSAFGGGRWG